MSSVIACDIDIEIYYHRTMDLKIIIVLIGISVLQTVAVDNHGRKVVKLKNDSFDEAVDKMPHFVMFYIPRR